MADETLIASAFLGAPLGSPGSAAVVSGRFRIIKGYLNFLDTYTPAHTETSADFR